MTSANQMFKESGSNLPFKEWLKREQLKGKLADGGNGNGNGNTWLDPSLIGFALGFALSHYVIKKR